MMGMLIYLLLMLAAGWGAVRILWPEPAADTGVCLVRAGLVVGVGLGLTSLTEFVWLLGLRGVPYSLQALDLLLAVGLPALAIRRMRRQAPPVAQDEPLGRTAWFMGLAFLGALAVNLAAFVAMSRRGPHGGWDAFAMWNMRARFFYQGGDRWVDGLAPSLPHSDYPLLVPTAIAHLFQYLGSSDPVAQMLVAGGFTFGAIALLTGALWRLRGPVAGLAGGMLLMGTASFVKLGGRQMADVPLSFWVLATVAMLCLADAEEERRRRRLLVLAGACAGFAAWTKNEGALVVVALLAVEAVRALASGLKHLPGRLGAIALGLLPVLLALGWFRLAFPLANDLVAGQGATSTLARLADPGRYALILKASGEQLLLGSEFLVPGLVVYLLIVGWPKRPRLPWAAGMVVLMALVYGAVYVVTPHDLTWHLATSLDRLILHVMPAALLVLLLAMGPGRASRGLVE